MKFRPIALLPLLVPVVQAAMPVLPGDLPSLVELEKLPGWFEPTRQAERATLQRLQRGRAEVDNVIASMGEDYLAAPPATPDESMPPAREGYAVAVADCGLLFDSDNSRVTYIGNVRVNEARMQMRCRNRLYIQLPANSVKKGEENVVRNVEANSAAAPSKAAPATAPQPATKPAAKPAPAAGPQEPAKPAPPLLVQAYDVMVNGMENNILLRSNGSDGVPLLRRDGTELILFPNRGDSTILADKLGNVHITAGKVVLNWTDEEGRHGSLAADRGHMVFNRENHTLYIDGPAHFTSPDGATLDCDKSFLVALMPEGDTSLPEQGGFLSQFTTLRYSGVKRAVAAGNVRAARPAQGETPAASAQGELCLYNGETGQCDIVGKACRLTYGKQEIRNESGNGRLTLTPGGDIWLQSDANVLAGTYELPARGKAPARLGKFRTNGPMTFNAQDGTVTLPGGIDAKDDVNHFRCNKQVLITLKRTGDKVPERSRVGMLNLAIAAYGEVASVSAGGNVDVHYVDSLKQVPMELRGDSVEFNLEKGTARLQRAPYISYGAYLLSAKSGAELITVDENGDIDVSAEKIHAVLPYHGGSAKLDTAGVLHLDRGTRELKLGPNSHLEAPDGILHSTDNLYVTLAPAETKDGGNGQTPDKPAISRYPHLDYSFGGIESARTEHGGTLRTTKASMQCTGPIHVAIAPETAGKGNDGLSRLKATAQGGVAVLGKDSAGRLIRATGDSLVVDGENKVLTGAKVTLADERNTHVASGAGARITIDKNNNARVTGSKQVTMATGLHQQTEKPESQGKKD